MQYFVALKIGEKRVKEAQELLSTFIDDRTPSMPALALKDNKSNNWEPVGEENLYAFVHESQGYLVAICDKNGIAKAIANWFSEDKKENIQRKILESGRLQEYIGKVSLPV
jgi:hypothetical protein